MVSQAKSVKERARHMQHVALQVEADRAGRGSRLKKGSIPTTLILTGVEVNVGK